MWMSLALRCRALNTVESTSLMMGLLSEVSLAMDSCSSLSSSSGMICSLNSSVASSRTRWLDSDFLRMS